MFRQINDFLNNLPFFRYRNGSKDEIVESNVPTPSEHRNLDNNEKKEQIEDKKVENNDTKENVTKNYQFDDSMIGKLQCGNLRIYLFFRFYVKSILTILKTQNQPAALNFREFLTFPSVKFSIIKIQSLQNC